MDRQNIKSRRRRNNDQRYASDYYYNSSQPAWNERNEETHRHNYGLPASGRVGHRRHDFSDWGNSNFTNTGTDRGYGLINDRRRVFDNEHIDYPSGREQSGTQGGGREYDYNRFGMGDQRGTWNQRQDESYDFGEHDRRERNRYDAENTKHRGKGPKGFKRTDERIQEDINSRLTDDGYVDASNIEVSVKDGEITLTGTVPDKSSKRRAEDIAELVSGVNNVENRLRIK
jgi:hypothetical protein